MRLIGRGISVGAAMQIVSAGALGLYQRTVTIDNTGNVSTLTDYQVRIELDYSANMRRDFNDIRFYSDGGGASALSHWREYYVEGETAIFWVKVASIPGSDTLDIYLRYGGGVTVSASDVTATMIAGQDFDDGDTTGLTINTAGSGTMTVPAITDEQIYGYRVDGGSKSVDNPLIVLGAGGTWDDEQARDMTIVTDENGYVVEEADGLWAYYGGYDGAVWKIGLAKSTDNGYTWTKYGSNPVLLPSGTPGSWYEEHVAQPSVIKEGGTWYMMCTGQESGVPSGTLGVFTSADGLTWVADGEKLTLASFTWDGVTGVEVTAVACMIKRSAGDYVVLFEGLKDGSATSEWAVFGATASSITGAWTPLNSGYPIFSATGSGWEETGVANPAIIEADDGQFIMAYNGIQHVDDGGDTSWRVGFAYSADLSSWTRYSGNPVLDLGAGGEWDDTHVETSFLVKEKSTVLRLFYQGFSDAVTPQIGLFMIPQKRHLHGEGAANADAFLAGVDLDGTTTFALEFLTQDTEDASSAPTAADYTALWDMAAVPSPDTSANHGPDFRFGVGRHGASDASAGKFEIQYRDVADGIHWWTGTIWTTQTLVGKKGIYKIQIIDDGTNYTLDILKWPKNTSALANPAAIAKANVKAFSNGRAALLGEIFTDIYYMGINYDDFFLRKYSVPEPSTSVGAESPV